MSVSITSIEAFETITKDGTRMTQKEKVHSAIKTMYSKMGYLAPTRREITKFTGLESSACTARINELMHEGKVVQMPKRKCNTTGKRVFPVVSIEDKNDAMEREIQRAFDDYNKNLVSERQKWMVVEFSNKYEKLDENYQGVAKFGYWSKVTEEEIKHIEDKANLKMTPFEIEGATEDKNAEYLYLISW